MKSLRAGASALRALAGRDIGAPLAPARPPAFVSLKDGSIGPPAEGPLPLMLHWPKVSATGLVSSYVSAAFSALRGNTLNALYIRSEKDAT